MKTHVPTPDGARTYCGRIAAQVKCIDRRNDCIDEATCRACGRVDDAQSVKTYREECKAAGVEP